MKEKEGKGKEREKRVRKKWGRKRIKKKKTYIPKRMNMKKKIS